MTRSLITLDPELRALLSGMPAMPALDAETLPLIRPFAVGATGRDPGETVTVAGGLRLQVIKPEKTTCGAPCVYWIHGGGMVMGDRFSQIDVPLEWRDRFGAVVVSVEYRLAPESSGTALVDDCHQGLRWVTENAAELGIDSGRVIVAGASAGGGLAAGVTLMARDRGTADIAGQVLIGPMLDHRTTSTRHYEVWTQEMNDFGWRSVLKDGVPNPYVSPALAADLDGLPAAYVDAGSAELFSDEATAYASRLGAELHIWAGGFHGFDALFPAAALSLAARRTRNDWIARLLAEKGQP
ncbi:alpha/beta hydrolase fold domain-containing protein [Actinoplanes derwentensis]|uniref:Acetyl esterase/lipase n=1 Tax=Actinoplanes derwentensis TaxID=113562 RepID=A0A1H1VX94_9ACTN|nr:alpha/beta hydrolase fold domain-containing protein [Actinoplanes derwentensis]GID83967.1 esterase [Actinoplanes derwentensis]SDS89061.1 Acetyl esterase/lipase [Actinoplanes derwentensis]